MLSILIIIIIITPSLCFLSLGHLQHGRIGNDLGPGDNLDLTDSRRRSARPQRVGDQNTGPRVLVCACVLVLIYTRERAVLVHSRRGHRHGITTSDSSRRPQVAACRQPQGPKVHRHSLNARLQGGEQQGRRAAAMRAGRVLFFPGASPLHEVPRGLKSLPSTTIYHLPSTTIYLVDCGRW